MKTRTLSIIWLVIIGILIAAFVFYTFMTDQAKLLEAVKAGGLICFGVLAIIMTLNAVRELMEP